jgi:tripartite-type tricarboxylate transporter receptor subunit TctC
MLSRRHVIAGSLVLVGSALTGAAEGQTYPSRPVTVVVPYPPGGSVDVVARILSDAMAADLGANLVVDNRGGASGALGSAAVSRAAPDGYTLLLGTQQTHATNPSLLANLSYDPVKDFVPVAGLAVIPHLLVTRKDLSAATVADFVALAKSKADGLTYGSTGPGSSSHLAMELFRKQTGIEELVHVPFRGAGPLVQELLGGRIDVAIISIPTVLPFIEAGDLRALAVARDKRVERLPAVPTTTEVGVPGVDADAWFVLFAPAGTPAPVVEHLFASVSKALAQPAVQQKLAEQSIVLELRPGTAVMETLPKEIQKWADVVKDAGVRT